MFLWFFFFKQKTAYELRISDWSSDVCSSDLDPREAGRPRGPRGCGPVRGRGRLPRDEERSKRSDARDRAAEDQPVDIVGALIGIHRLEVGEMAHHMEFGRYAVTAVHVPRDARDI